MNEAKESFSLSSPFCTNICADYGNMALSLYPCCISCLSWDGILEKELEKSWKGVGSSFPH